MKDCPKQSLTCWCQSRRNRLVGLELRKEGTEIQVLRRSRSDFGRGYSVSAVMTVKYHEWSKRWCRTGKKFEWRHLQSARVDSTDATASYTRAGASLTPTFHDHTIEGTL